MLDWIVPAPSLDPLVVWGLLPRFIGALYAFAFLSLLPQVVLFAGSSGPSPMRDKLDALRRDYGRWHRFALFPTLLWLNSSDAAMRALCFGGIIAGGIAVVGGPWAPFAIVACWAFYISLDGGGLSFPWDQLLLELGFWGALLPAPLLLPDVNASSAPAPLLAFSLQFLAARLMLGFAKVKFIGAKKSDRLYLKPFFVWMPVPHVLGWWAYRAPRWFHRSSLHFMFFAEVVCPLLLFFPGWPRLIGTAGLVALMLGIHFTGNWGFFNVGYILLCVCGLDVTTSLAQLSLSDATHSVPAFLRHVIVAAALAYAFLLLLAGNSWVNRSWPYWPLWERLSARSTLVRVLFKLLRPLAAMRWLNSYGVFPPNISPAIRQTPVFEGSDDGEEWKRYRYRFLPSAPSHRPPIVAPHHPRLDHALPYASGGLGDDSLIGSILGSGTPPSTYVRYGILPQTMQLLLSDATFALRAFGSSPFGDRCPRFLRVRMVALSPTTVGEKKATGHYWHERAIGTLANACERDDGIRARENHPECAHPDLVYWKARALPLKKMVAAFDGKGAFEDALNAGSDLTRDDIDRFFSEWVPLVAPHLAVDGVNPNADLNTALLDEADAFRANFSEKEREIFERILERAAWLLRSQLLPHLWGGVAPVAPRQPAFRTHMVLQALVCDGREALARALNDPASVVHRFTLASDESDRQRQLRRHLIPLLFFRTNVVEFTARVFRWNTVGDMLEGNKLPSIFEYSEALLSIAPRGEVWRPSFERDDEGLPLVEDEMRRTELSA